MLPYSHVYKWKWMEQEVQCDRTFSLEGNSSDLKGDFNVRENVKENNLELFLGWEDPYLLNYHLQNGKHDTLLSYGYTS